MILDPATINGYHYRSAVERAEIEGIEAIPSRISGVYATTRGNDGMAVYTTDARLTSLGCTCMAGESGKVCKHLAKAARAFGTSNEIARRAR